MAVDLVQAQKDMLQLLLSSAQLANINFVLQREMQLKAALDVATVWTTPRNGYAGIGGIVEMPTANCDEPQVQGPIMDWVFSIHVLEVPGLNFAVAQTGQPAKGTQIAAEEVVQMILDEVHHYADEHLATFKALQRPVSPASLPPMAIGYRVSFTLQKARTAQTLRTGQVKAYVGGGVLSLTCHDDPTAAIWYTTDLSFPANSSTINSAATLYTGQVFASGTQIRARAYATGKLGSAAMYTVVP